VHDDSELFVLFVFPFVPLNIQNNISR